MLARASWEDDGLREVVVSRSRFRRLEVLEVEGRERKAEVREVLERGAVCWGRRRVCRSPVKVGILGGILSWWLAMLPGVDVVSL